MSTGPRPRSTAKRGIGDLIGGFVAGLYSVPEGIGYAALAGISPVIGIYAGMVPVAVAAAATGSVLMMSTLTSAIALTMGGVLADTGLAGDQASQAVFTTTLVAGAIMVLLGVLRLGRVVNLVSNAVMTGFVTGVAVLIIVGKFDDIFGYDPAGIDNKVARAVDIVLHPGRWDVPTAVVGIGTIVLAFGLKAIPRLEKYALVLVVVAGTAAVWLLPLDVTVIADTATIPAGLAALPIPTSLDLLPDPGMIPTLLSGSAAIAIVALAQGAGIRPAFPNPDGSRASASRDFLGQGLGNLVGAFFQSAPTGGSLSRTAVSADGGATSRRAGLFAAATVVVLVVALGPVVGQIPEAVIGGLLFVIGVEIVIGRIPDARLAWQTGLRPSLLFVITLVLTLVVPLQWAIFGGTLLSLAAFVVASASGTELQRLTPVDSGWLVDHEIPSTLPSDRPLVLRYPGPDFFAATPQIAERLPDPDPDHPGVVVLDAGELTTFSSTLLKQVAAYQRKLRAVGSGLVVSGVSPSARHILERTGLLELIGEANVLGTDPRLHGSFELGLRRAEALLDELRVAKSHAVGGEDGGSNELSGSAAAGDPSAAPEQDDGAGGSSSEVAGR